MNNRTGRKNLTAKDKLNLERLLESDIHKNTIAEYLNVNIRTIYNEINRGTINGRYSAEYSINKTLQSNKAKGKTPKLLVDKNLAFYLSLLILEEHLSINQVIKRCKEMNIACPSKQALYTAIDRGLIPNVTRNSLKPNTTTMFSNGLVQIPKYMRAELNLQDKDVLKIILDGNKIIIEKQT